MKVKELVAKLLQQDQELDILAEADDEGGAYDIADVQIDRCLDDNGVAQPIAVIKIVQDCVYMKPE